jgi:AAA+ superfamily predicted ATPase
VSLVEHLKIRTPLVWVNTPEPNRYQDVVMRFCSSDLYAIDPKLGFSIWDRKSKQWKPILFEIENPATGEVIEAATFEMSLAIGYVLDNPGTMIIHFAHKVAEEMSGLFAWVFGDYRKAFHQDDKALLGPQFVLFSHGADIPQDLTHLLTVVEPALPTSTELAEIAAHVEASIGEHLTSEVDLSKVGMCGMGLTEPEFIQSCLLSVRERKALDPQFINEYKMAKIRAGGNLEIRRPGSGLDSIGGMDNAKKMIRHIKWMWDNEAEAHELGLEPLRRVLLVGVPGTGKSAICEATAKELDLDLAKTGISQSLNKFIGQSEENMRQVFRQIRALAPIVCWIDEFGRDVSQGNWQGDGGTTSRVHGEFLTGIQELPKNVFLMCAANQIGHVAPEMLRADRFDKILFVGFPTKLERVEIFKIHLGASANDFDLEALADNSPMFTGAEIKALIRETKSNVHMEERRPITTKDLLDFIPNMKNRIWLRHPNEVRDMYIRALEDWDWASSAQQGEAALVIDGRAGQIVTSGRHAYSGF